MKSIDCAALIRAWGTEDFVQTKTNVLAARFWAEWKCFETPQSGANWKDSVNFKFTILIENRLSIYLFHVQQNLKELERKVGRMVLFTIFNSISMCDVFNFRHVLVRPGVVNFIYYLQYQLQPWLGIALCFKWSWYCSYLCYWRS